jgi:succinate dehydrogenase/fumarate reductase cytochrome b subunit
MKKILAQVSGAIAASQILAYKAFAQLDEPDVIPGLQGGDGVDGIKNAIITVLTTILNFILLIAVVYVVIAGIRLIVSGGDEGEKDKAKQTIIYVIVGIIIVLFARVIVSFVNNIVTSA